MNKITRIEINQLGSEDISISILRADGNAIDYTTESIRFRTANWLMSALNTRLKTGTWKAVSIADIGYWDVELVIAFEPVKVREYPFLSDEDNEKIVNITEDLRELGFDVSNIGALTLLKYHEKANGDSSFSYWDNLEGLAIANYLPKLKSENSNE